MEAEVERLARLQVEAELDLYVFYIAGEARGPVVDEVRIGASKRGIGGASYKNFLKMFRLYRARPIVAHVELVVSSEATVRRLKAAVQIQLVEDWRKISELFWRVPPAEAKEIVARVIADEEIKVLTSGEADALEVKRFNQLMDRFAGG